ncbi:MAG: T9SS type A sorting domain-containing protein, partial [Ignavibacteriaceae bacterium]
GDHNTTLILTGSGNTFIYQAYVGRLELLANESFEVFVDDEAIQTGTIGNLIGNSARTWYDGISYAKVSEVVPVELTSFTAAQNGSSIDLNWNTASELNNRGFEIEKQNTNDNKYGNWVLIGFVKGQGTSTESTEYFYKDNNIDNFVSSVRYRLKQIDYDGTFDYSDAVEVIGITPVSFNLNQNYPNPFNPSTTIEYDIAKEEFITLKIYNVVGEVVETLVNENLTAGNYKITWNAQNVPSGVYFYRLTAGTFKEFKKMMLLK